MSGAGASAALRSADRVALLELAPVLRRAVTLDPRAIARCRIHDRAATILLRLPFRVLIARTVVVADARAGAVDVTVGAAAALAWLDGDAPEPPPARDAEWRGGLPPAEGWRRLDTVPDGVIRPLVRQGALALKEAADREGVPGAQPRAEVADALLDAAVLAVSDDAGRRAEIPLRTLSALTRMGFLRRGGAVHVDVVGRWVRVVGEFGTVYLERPGLGLQLA